MNGWSGNDAARRPIGLPNGQSSHCLDWWPGKWRNILKTVPFHQWNPYSIPEEMSLSFPFPVAQLLLSCSSPAWGIWNGDGHSYLVPRRVNTRMTSSWQTAEWLPQSLSILSVPWGLSVTAELNALNMKACSKAVCLNTCLWLLAFSKKTRARSWVADD